MGVFLKIIIRSSPLYVCENYNRLVFFHNMKMSLDLLKKKQKNNLFPKDINLTKTFERCEIGEFF